MIGNTRVRDSRKPIHERYRAHTTTARSGSVDQARSGLTQTFVIVGARRIAAANHNLAASIIRDTCDAGQMGHFPNDRRSSATDRLKTADFGRSLDCFGIDCCGPPRPPSETSHEMRWRLAPRRTGRRAALKKGPAREGCSTAGQGWRTQAGEPRIKSAQDN